MPKTGLTLGFRVNLSTPFGAGQPGTVSDLEPRDFPIVLALMLVAWFSLDGRIALVKLQNYDVVAGTSEDLTKKFKLLNSMASPLIS